MTPREWLFALEQFGIKLGLDNIRALLDALNHPEQSWLGIHVGGTNGKGSVSAMVEHGLRAAGHHTGRYTSPHLDRIEERVAIDGLPVDEAEFDRATEHVLRVVDQLRDSGALQAQPTFFEATTAIAFELFRRARVSVAAIEVGLGGRFDATNVFTPEVAAITSIALDHERHLGASIEEIAFEKAGIAKPGVPLVLGDMPDAATRVIEEVAGARRTPIVSARTEEHVEKADLIKGRAELSLRTPVRAYGPLRLGLNGRHQIANAVVAVRTLEMCNESGLRIGEQHIASALCDVSWPARLEWLQLSGGGAVLLDAAHNPAGAAALADYLEEIGIAPIPIVIAVMKDKNVVGMIEPLAAVASLFVTTQAPSPRSREAGELATLIAGHSPDTRVIEGGAPEQALNAALNASPRVAIAGSIFLVGPMRAHLLREGAMTVTGPPLPT